MEKVTRAALVYQGGIANVFEVRSFNLSDYGREAVRLLQSDFRECESFARGLQRAGCKVVVAYCNECGDISRRTWNEAYDDAPFNNRQAYVATGSEGLTFNDNFAN